MFALAACLAFHPSLSYAQDPGTQSPPRGERGGPRGERAGGGGGGMMMMGGGNAGQITKVSGDTITIKTLSGSELTLKTSAETRFVGKDRSMIALKDLKAGDYVMAAGGGQPVDGVLQPRFVAQMDEAGVKRMQDFQANLGKTVIAGEVKAIEDTRLTIARPDGQTQVIELDEGTSLRRGRDESITLADVKTGDRVFGQGELKNGVFVPKELRVMGQMSMRRPRDQQGDRPTTNTPPPESPK